MEQVKDNFTPKLIKGMNAIDLIHCSSKQIKELKKFPNISKMTLEELDNEFWELQDQIDRMSDESEEMEILCLRQQVLNNKTEELLGGTL